MNRKTNLLMFIVGIVASMILCFHSNIFIMATWGVKGTRKIFIMLWGILFVVLVFAMCIIKRKEHKFYTKPLILGGIIGIVIIIILVYVFGLYSEWYFSPLIVYQGIDIVTIEYTAIILIYLFICNVMSVIINKMVYWTRNKSKKS